MYEDVELGSIFHPSTVVLVTQWYHDMQDLEDFPRCYPMVKVTPSDRPPILRFPFCRLRRRPES
jgi:hypothetical protein